MAAPRFGQNCVLANEVTEVTSIFATSRQLLGIWRWHTRERGPWEASGGRRR